jgi:hypothetical protein
MTTTLYHAAYRTIRGLSFQIGATTLFTPVNDDHVYVIDHPAQLVITAPVPERMAAFLAEIVIAPRLERLGGAA